jgi:hypothetical protein
MSKNRIIPQMFDVRPVDEAGDLDWRKIQSIVPDSENEKVQKVKEKLANQAEKEQKKLKQFAQQQSLQKKNELLRKQNEIQIKIATHKREIAILADKEQRERNRKLLLEAERKRLESKQYLASEKMQSRQKEKDAMLLAQKNQQENQRQRAFQSQALARQEQTQRISEISRNQSRVAEEKILLERKKREHEESQWLEQKLKEDAKRQEREDALTKIAEKRKKKEQEKAEMLTVKKSKNHFYWEDIFSPTSFAFQFDIQRSLRSFALVAMIVFMGVGTVMYASKGFGMKGRVLGVSSDGMENLNLAIKDIAHQNFEDSSLQFDKAIANFSQGAQQVNSMGGIILDVAHYVPFASKISSGKNAVEAGKHFAVAGKSLNEVAKVAAGIKNATSDPSQNNLSLLEILSICEKNLTEVKSELDAAQGNIDLILVDDLPEDKRSKFVLVKQTLPDLRSALELFLNNTHILTDLLGGNGPRKYLFLFQNNSEMRATGGFIGSYGLLDIANGHIKNFFIDGIFNPDGQLRERIVPPLPIQKISANWSMHDSNWFADFPTSAKKAIYFYEKTGGPTADGVITLTPTIMQKLLEITGPIEMSAYNVTLDSQNFIELTQYKVEVDYDKQENKPKKILSDLAPMILEKLLSSNDLTVVSKTLQAFLDGLKEKHILFYSENNELQNMIAKQGWSGEIIATNKDYISVINTNVNGYKTDAIVDESIEHQASIQEDGSIIDTVTITRKHNGGNSPYEWLNKVNADYMRVYVPSGSKLLEVTGQTREVNSPPINYDALGFTRDNDVQNEESHISIDQESGTRIYQEQDKTVFANWTYVSPQETMVITYKYLLPFTLFKVAIADKQQADSYGLVAQKQSGSLGSSFVSHISYPASFENKWNFPEKNQVFHNELLSETKLDVDRFFGIVFEKK